MQEDKILLIRQWFKHMGIHSGYDNVFHHLDSLQPNRFISVHRGNNKKVDPFSYVFSKLIHNRIKRTSFYRQSAYKIELNAFWKARKQETKLIHFTYLENNYALFNTDWFRKKLEDKKIVGTIHQPMSWWKENGDLSFLKNLDALVTLSDHEKSLFDPVLPGKVHAIPHAVSTEFFKPSEKPKPAGFRCATIGYWMRDYETLNKIISHLVKELPEIQFDILYNKKIEDNPHLKPLLDFKQVHFHSRISNEELLSIYHHADLLLLPLLDCTANNALLEGVSCGLPVLTNHVGGVKSYTDQSFTTYFEKGDHKAMIEQVKKGYQNKNELQTKSGLARNFSLENLSLEVIGKKLNSLYTKILTENE